MNGENDKASPEKIPLAKKRVPGAFQKLTRQELPKSAAALHVRSAKVAEAPVRAIGRTGWKKHSDVRLGEYLVGRKIRRPRP